MEFGNDTQTDCISCNEKCPHNIVFAGDSIVHLRCSECKVVNAFVLDKTKGKKKVNRKKGKHLDHAALLERQGSEPFKTYSASGTFTDGQYLNHLKFGEGYVLAVSSPPEKMGVLFADTRRMLACGPESTSGAQIANPFNGSLAKPRKASPRPRAKIFRAESLPSDEPVECPRCGQVVHPYNINKDPKGRVVGCMRCK